MKIKLTQGKFALIDDIDADLDEYRWCVNIKHSDTYYAYRQLFYFNGNQTHITMHRVIAERMGIKHPDHINRNGLDNRRSNLREATQSQNNANRRLRKDNPSGYRGVRWHKVAKKWQARIRVNKKEISLGYFDDIKDAAKAYNKAALKYFGEFAVLNKI